MNDLKLPGVIFRPITFKVLNGDQKDKILNGVQIHFSDYDKVNLLELQFYFMQEHYKLYPEKDPFSLTSANRIKMFDKVMGTDKVRKKFSKRFQVDDIKRILRKDAGWFKQLSKRYYLYN